MWISDLHDVSLTLPDLEDAQGTSVTLRIGLSAMAGATRSRLTGGHFLLTDGRAKKEKASMRHSVGKPSSKTLAPNIPSLEGHLSG